MLYDKPKKKRGNLFNLISLRAAAVIVLGSLLILGLYLKVDFFRQAVDRFIASDTDGYNAIAGRTTKGSALLETLTPIQRIIGVSDSMGDLGRAVSGCQGEFYQYGVIGIILSYAYYVWGTLKSRKNHAIYLGIILLVLSFVCAHTHREFYMMYFTIFLVDGMSAYQKDLQGRT